MSASPESLKVAVCLCVEGELFACESVWRRWLETGDESCCGEVWLLGSEKLKEQSRWVAERTFVDGEMVALARVALEKNATVFVFLRGSLFLPLKTLKDMNLTTSRREKGCAVVCRRDLETILRDVADEDFADMVAKMVKEEVFLTFDLGNLETTSPFYFLESSMELTGEEWFKKVSPSKLEEEEERAKKRSKRMMWRPSDCWPLNRPTASVFEHGWFLETHVRVMERLLTDSTTCVVELGSWYGASTKWMADKAKNATIYAIDIWDENHIFRDNHYTKEKSMIRKHPLYATFLRNLWDHRERVVPLRMRTTEGLQLLKDQGLEPDLIYIDADHHYPAVKADIANCLRLFPKALLVGDDYGNYDDVKRAVCECAFNHSKRVYVDQNHCWTYANLSLSDTASAFHPEPPENASFADLLAGYK